MNYNFESAIRKFEQDKNNPIIIRHVEACHFYATKILKLSPNDKEANKRYTWSLEVLSKKYL